MPPNYKPYLKLLIKVALLVSIYALLLVVPSRVVYHSVFLAIFLAWTWFTIPGFILSSMLFKRINWLERIPIAFVLAIGLGTPLTILAILTHMELARFQTLMCGVFAIVCLFFIIYSLHLLRAENIPPLHEQNPEVGPERIKGGMFALILLVCFLAGLLAFYASQWAPAGDDLAGMAGFAEILRLGRITGTEPFHGSGTPSTPRNEFVVWSVQGILVCRVAGTLSPEFFVNCRPIFIILAFLAFYTLVHQFFKNQLLSLFLVSLWATYLLSRMQVDSTGNDMVTRIFQDKFLGWFVVVPIALCCMLWYLESQRLRYLLGFGIVSFGATFVHPITLTQIMILGGGFGTVYFLFNKTRKSFVSLFWLATILAICLLVPVYQYIQYSGYMPIEAAGLQDAVEFGRISMAVGRDRLWLLENGKYILHPSIILQPIVLFSYIALIVLVFKLKNNNAARLIIGSMILMSVIFYLPPLAMLVGKFVTPYLMWRLAWPFPALAVLAIGWTAWLLIESITVIIRRVNNGFARIFQNTLVVLAVCLALYLLRVDINAGFSDFKERQTAQVYSTCQRAQDMLSYVDQLAYNNFVDVLAPKKLNYCIPALAPLANVIEFRGYGTVNRLPIDLIEDSLQRVTDSEYFSASTMVDDQVAGIIDRYGIDYVLVEKEQLYLDLQLRYQPEFFSLIYSDQNYALYEVTNSKPQSIIIDGNSAIRLRDWVTAERIFTQAIEEDPNQLLAYIGMANTLEGEGDIQGSLAFLEKAALIAPNEPAVHARLGEAYFVTQTNDKAINEYQQAVDLAPYSPSLHISLGLAQLTFGNEELSMENFVSATKSQASINTAYFYSQLAGILSSVGWTDAAINNYNQAISIQPDPYLYYSLSQAYIASGNIPEAIQSAKKAIQMDEWLDLPHVQLGGIYLSENLVDEAIEEYEQAWRLNPANPSVFNSLGSAINASSGVDAAIARLEDLQTINLVLPGPYKGLATLYLIKGDVNTALKELNIVSNILPGDTATQISIGDIYRNNGQVEEAQQAYEKALSINPDLVPARLRISLIYNQSNQLGPQMGQLYRIARTIPSAAWPHLNLSGLYQRLGNWEASEKEILWAQKIEPQNSSVYIAYGNYLRVTGKQDQAMIQYRNAIELQPEFVDAYLDLALLYENIGEMDAAKIILDKALALGVVYEASVRSALASYYLQRNDPQMAIQQYNKTIEAEPDIIDAYLALSNVYIQQGELDAAETTLQQAMQNVVDNTAAYDKLADLELFRSDEQAALDWLVKATVANPESGQAYVNLADEYWRRGKIDEAIQYYQQAIVMDPLISTPYSQMTTLLINQGQYQLAEKVYQAWIQAFPYTSVPYQGLGDLYLRLGQLDLAETVLRQAMTIFPETTDAFLSMSKIYQLRGDWDEAIDILKTGVAALPYQVESYRNLARIYMQTNKYTEAENTLKQAIVAVPSDINSYQGLSQLALMRGDAYAAETLLIKSINASGDSSDAHINLAGFYETIGEYGKAEEHYIAASTISPTSSNYQTLGQFYQRRNRQQDALEAFTKALSIIPNPGYLYVLVGNSYLALNNPQEALKWYQDAQSINKTDPIPYIWLSIYYQSQENWNMALEALNNGIAIQPSNVTLHLTLGSLYQRLGDFDLALSEFESACAQDSRLADCQVYIGNLYKAQGQWSSAIDHYNRATRIDPTEISAYAGWGQVYQIQGYISEADYMYELAVEKSLDQLTALSTRASYYAGKGEWGKAQADYEKAWQLYPYSQAAGGQLASFYSQRGEWGKSLAIRLQLISLPSVTAQTYIDLGKVYETRADWTSALSEYNHAIEVDRSYPGTYLSIANVYNLLGENDEALQAVITATIIASFDPSTWIALGDAYLARLDFDAAKLAYQKALEISPGLNVSAAVKLDNLSLKMGEKGSDLTSIQSKAAIVPSAGIYITLGYQYQLRGDWGTALQWYQRAVVLEPYNSAGWLTLGNYYRSIREWDHAYDALKKALQYSPSSSDILLAIGSVQAELGLVDQATESYNQAIQANPTQIACYTTLASLQAETDQAAAIETLTKGLSMAPTGIGVYQTLGGIYSIAGDFELATEIYHQGLAIVPGAARLYVSLAIVDKSNVLEAQQSLAIAEAIYNYWEYKYNTASTSEQQQSAHVSLEDAETEYGMAQNQLKAAIAASQMAMNDLEVAQNAYQEALRLQPDNADALIGLGQLADALGDKENALSYYEKAVALNPTSVAALNALGYAYLDFERPEDAFITFEKSLKYSPTNLGAQFGLVRAYTFLGQSDAMSSAATTYYSSHWWTNFIEYFREREK